MAAHFCISIFFLDAVPAFHGRRDSGAPEWPPSPLRLFQALIAAAGRLEPANIAATSRASLEWLERQRTPVIVAPRVAQSIGRRISVPNNAMDIVARAWSRGNESGIGDADPRTHRTMKTVRPLWLLEPSAIRYAWSIEELNAEVEECTARISRLARSIVALGWGVDMVAGDGSLISDAALHGFDGERWVAGRRGAVGGLRVPLPGTFADSRRRYEQFLSRLGPNGLRAPQPLIRYDTVSYQSVTKPHTRQVAAFALRRIEANNYRAFDAVRRGLTVAGMLRYATKTAALNAGWSPDKVDSFVLGHGERPRDAHVPVGSRRFAYLPLPSIEYRGDGKESVGTIRRVLVTALSDECEDEVAWAANALAAQDIVDEKSGEVLALLAPLPPTDAVYLRYTSKASTWSTVTPVVLPGYDDPNHLRRKLSQPGITAEKQQRYIEQLSDRIERLLRRALVHAGFPVELAEHAEIEWRTIGYLHGVGPAKGYGVPEHLRNLPRYHVKLRFLDSRGSSVNVRGPLCIGSGRYYGVGLFAAHDVSPRN